MRTGELKIKVHSKKYAKELTQIIKNENIMINMKTKQSEIVPFSITNRYEN
jgi:hypothetical protein